LGGDAEPEDVGIDKPNAQTLRRKRHRNIRGEAAFAYAALARADQINAGESVSAKRVSSKRTTAEQLGLEFGALFGCHYGHVHFEVR